MRPILACSLAVALLGIAAPAFADPDVVLSPQTFELTTEETATFTETLTAEQDGGYLLFLRNGDQESSQVTDVTVQINGEAVIASGDLEPGRPGLRKIVELQAGDNEMVIEVEGPPGSFVTLAVGRPDRLPVFVHGRMLLPWGRDDDDRALVLALKNGSNLFPRSFRVVFFRPNGEVAATSERLPLPPRGSVALTVEELIGDADWQVGSVEIFYAGRGAGRLFGSARQLSADPLITAETQPLEAAGLQIFRPRPDRDGTTGRGRRP